MLLKIGKLFCVTTVLCLILLPKISSAKEPPFSLIYEDKTFKISGDDLAELKSPAKYSQTSLLVSVNKPKDAAAAYFGSAPSANSLEADFKIYKYRPDKIYALLKNISLQINVPKIEPILEIKDNKVLNFSPPKKGLSLNLYDSTFQIIDALNKNQLTQTLTVEAENPAILLSQTNNIGIKELLAFGESSFKGSPKNRIHNIKIGLNKFKGLIIKPKEEFSFNAFLGPVEESEGFLPELVIKASGTVPELGGGLCQVSSTTFRAAMNAGLPITQRKNHAYAVQYYAPQGTDATIYPGSVDLKFINDTPGAILIWPYIKDTYKLVFEFYGTLDSRKVTLQTPVQYDRKPDGSLKAYWTRIIEKDGEISTSTFKSLYLPPALFHKEEKFVPAAATAAPANQQVPQIN